MSTAEAILVDIKGLATMLQVSPNKARLYLQEFPALAASRVVLGHRCVRYRVATIRAFIDALPSVPIAEPSQLVRGKAEARVAAEAR